MDYIVSHITFCLPYIWNIRGFRESTEITVWKSTSTHWEQTFSNRIVNMNLSQLYWACCWHQIVNVLTDETMYHFHYAGMICFISVCTATFTNTDVMELAQKLRQLSESSYSSLTELNISILPCPELLVILMEAIPYITSMHMEVQTVWGYWNLPPHYNQTDKSGDVKLISDWNKTWKWAGVKFYRTCWNTCRNV